MCSSYVFKLQDLPVLTFFFSRYLLFKFTTQLLQLLFFTIFYIDLRYMIKSIRKMSPLFLTGHQGKSGFNSYHSISQRTRTRHHMSTQIVYQLITREVTPVPPTHCPYTFRLCSPLGRSILVLMWPTKIANVYILHEQII